MIKFVILSAWKIKGSSLFQLWPILSKSWHFRKVIPLFSGAASLAARISGGRPRGRVWEEDVSPRILLTLLEASDRPQHHAPRAHADIWQWKAKWLKQGHSRAAGTPCSADQQEEKWVSRSATQSMLCLSLKSSLSFRFSFARADWRGKNGARHLE